MWEIRGEVDRARFTAYPIIEFLSRVEFEGFGDFLSYTCLLMRIAGRGCVRERRLLWKRMCGKETKTCSGEAEGGWVYVAEIYACGMNFEVCVV